MEVGGLFQNFIRYMSNGKGDIVSFSEGTRKELQNLNNGTQPSHLFFMTHSYTYMAETDSSEF